MKKGEQQRRGEGLGSCGETNGSMHVDLLHLTPGSLFTTILENEQE